MENAMNATPANDMIEISVDEYVAMANEVAALKDENARFAKRLEDEKERCADELEKQEKEYCAALRKHDENKVFLQLSEYELKRLLALDERVRAVERFCNCVAYPSNEDILAILGITRRKEDK